MTVTRKLFLVGAGGQAGDKLPVRQSLSSVCRLLSSVFAVDARTSCVAERGRILWLVG